LRILPGKLASVMMLSGNSVTIEAAGVKYVKFHGTLHCRYCFQSNSTMVHNTEPRYDWYRKQRVLPLNSTICRLLKVGNQMVQVDGDMRYRAVSRSGESGHSGSP
jgi:hypothetical protein